MMKTSTDKLLADLQQVAETLSPQEVPGCLVKLAAIQTVLATRIPVVGFNTSLPSSDADGQDLLTVADCAKKTQLTMQFIYEAVRRRELKASRIGKHVRVKPEDLTDWIERNGNFS